MNRDRNDEDEEDVCCPICLAVVKTGKETRLPCQHVMHKKCYNRLQSMGHWRCPNCREPFAKRKNKCRQEVSSSNAPSHQNDRSSNNSVGPLWETFGFRQSKNDDNVSLEQEEKQKQDSSPAVTNRKKREVTAGNPRTHHCRKVPYVEMCNDNSECREEFHDQLFENLTDESFFRFFSSNLLYEESKTIL